MNRESINWMETFLEVRKNTNAYIDRTRMLFEMNAQCTISPIIDLPIYSNHIHLLVSHDIKPIPKRFPTLHSKDQFPHARQYCLLASRFGQQFSDYTAVLQRRKEGKRIPKNLEEANLRLNTPAILYSLILPMNSIPEFTYKFMQHNKNIVQETFTPKPIRLCRVPGEKLNLHPDL